MANCLSLVAGEDLNQCRLELIGAAKDLPGGYVVKHSLIWWCQKSKKIPSGGDTSSFFLNCLQQKRAVLFFLAKQQVPAFVALESFQK